MTVSLMSLLGVNVNLPAGMSSEEPGAVALTGTGDAAFNTVMAAAELQNISAEQLRAFFVAHGQEVPAALQNGKNQTAGQVLAQMVAAKDGKKLPGGLIVALQNILPQNVMDEVEHTLAAMQQPEGGESADLLAALPQRELTPEELSELVQQTGFPPIVIFAALQDTPAASPNLAHAMVEDMGAAEADANLPLPRGAVPVAGETLATPQTAGVAETEAANTTIPAQAQAKTLPAQSQSELGAQVSSQIAAVDFSALDENKRDVIKRIVEVLSGEKAQAEFVWPATTKPVAANGNEKVADSATKWNINAVENAKVPVVADMQVNVQAKASTPAPATPNHTLPAVAEEVAFTATNNQEDALSAKPVVNAQAKASLEAQLSPANIALDAAKPAPQTASQVTDGPQQTPSFVAALEQSSALHGAGTADTVSAHLRHQPATQTGNPVEQVAVHVGKALADGSSKMEIHLKPAELGRVELRIETDADGRSHVVVTADKRDTLDMLQRDARGLERALADAGLKTDSNSLSFNLRGGEGQQHAQGERNGQNAKPAFDMNTNYADLEEKIGESEMALTYDAGRAYRLNIDRGVDISV